MQSKLYEYCFVEFTGLKAEFYGRPLTPVKKKKDKNLK